MSEGQHASPVAPTEVQPAVDAGSRPVSWAPVAKVNLLPLEVLETRSFRRTQVSLAASVVLVLAAIAVGTVWAQNGVKNAQAEADAAANRVIRLQQQQTEYSEVPKIYAQVEAATAARKQVYVGDVPWSRYINQLDRARPSGVEYQSVQMTLVTGTAAPIDPLTPAAVATLAIEGSTSSYTGVADWMAAFDELRGFQSSELKSATKDEQSSNTTFSVTGVVGSSSLSGRYQKPGTEPGSGN
ncbi:PilN domain-containing protein [Kineosporia babensis]|uniref:Fimbrial assembly protein n=1 Tax=Kineosporia babensis TaxID=499548 RepID=A0A9X1SXL6_9ACTN|nr:hypothetical protein [Kineosporia babensis]MCD5316347.1 hypothetical protein [Kineosporia babensis]